MPRISRRRLLQGAAGGAIGTVAGPLIGRIAPAAAAGGVTCPNPDPVINENHCTDPNTWSSEFQLANYDGLVTGYAGVTSVDVGGSVPLHLNTYGPATTAALYVFRLGYYGGAGGRLVYTSPALTLANTPATAYDQFGARNCTLWPVATTLGGAGTTSAAATAVSGVYLVRIVDNTGHDNHIIYIVRDDSRARDLLVVMPTNSWQAYNNWAGKSLYFFNSDTAVPGSGVPTPSPIIPRADGNARAVKVSFDRPHGNVFSEYNWVLHTEFPLIHWLEQQGYSLTYADDGVLDSAPAQLAPARTRGVVLAGHSEYWTESMRQNMLAARDAGTSLVSFSANSTYWRVRYEDNGRTLVCFKTVEGSGSSGSGAVGVNDWGPGAPMGATASDARGQDARAGTGDDHPEYATTTFRDPGIFWSDPDSQKPPGGRVGPGGLIAPGGGGSAEPQGRGEPENALWGVMYVGDDDNGAYPLVVPAGAGNGGEFAAHRAWRNTPVAGAGASIGRYLVGWEWDGIPGPNAQDAHSLQPYAASQPSGVQRISETDIAALPHPSNTAFEFLQDAGRVYSSTPQATQGSKVHAVTYRAASGALVFASGTMQWSWGLGPHYLHQLDVNGNYRSATYAEPQRSDADPRIQQATYNILADCGVHPATPASTLVLDPVPSPAGGSTPPAGGGGGGSGGGGSAPPPTQPPTRHHAATLGVAHAAMSPDARGLVRVRLAAHADGNGPLTGRLSLSAVLATRSRRGRPVKPTRIATAPFRVGSGHTVDVTLRLSPATRRALAVRRRLTVTVVATGSDPAGDRAAARATLLLTAPRVLIHGRRANRPA